MEQFKMKATVYTNTFEAEGRYEDVAAQFKLWTTLLSPSSKPAPMTTPSETPNSETGVKSLWASGDPTLARLFEVQEEILRLRSLPDEGPTKDRDGILALLLGFREIKGVSEVTGVRLMQSLNKSGITPDRIDRVVGAMTDLVGRNGAHRGTRYYLTTGGLSKAQETAQVLLGKLPH